ncbi:MAG: zinc-ribbon domain-containing protein [Nitrosomonadales bacterium]|nr:zinc-ribbon domain-containing protein [Nitrosomonadales bacterium]
MSTSTQCPQCHTRFKVSQEQLDAHQGMVRCGRCQAVFNAAEHLQDDQPSPQLDLPIAPEETRQTPAEAVYQELDFSRTDTVHIKTPGKKTGAAGPVTLAQQITFSGGLGNALPEPAGKKSSWPWAVGCLLLLIMLLAQAAYFFRVELAANLPGLKPALTSYCGLLQCTVPLPQKADLVSIESSDLEADPAQSNFIILNALLHNRAPYAQAYPNLELTLTDTQDKALARRTFLPAEYLKPGEDEKQGLAANRELSVKLNLDTTDLKPSGYRLFLFYPQ